MNTISITTSQNIELEFELGSVGDRILSRILDKVVVIAYVGIIIAMIGFGKLENFFRLNLWFVVLFIGSPLVCYHLLSEMFLNGQSLGKKIMGIRVISLTGGQPTYSQYLIRWIFRIVDFTFSGSLVALIMVAASEKKQRLGDIIAGTVVVKTRSRIQITDTLFHQPQHENHQVLYPEVIHLKDEDVELIKEILRSVNRSGNLALAFQAQQKVENLLGIKSKHYDSKGFLNAVLIDYNFITSTL